MNTRNIPRIPYEDFISSSGDENPKEDPNDDDFEESVSIRTRVSCNPKNPPKPCVSRIRHFKRHRSVIDERFDETDTFRLAVRDRITGFAVHNRVTDNDPRCTENPLGNSCRFMKLCEIEDVLLDPKKYFCGSAGVNVLVPEWDIASLNKMQFFGLETQVPQMDERQVSALSDKEIEEMIAELDEEIEKYDQIPATVEKPIVVCPFPRSGLLISIKHDVRTYNWEALGANIQFDVILMDPPWRIQVGKATRGVQLRYDQLPTNEIMAMPLHLVQKNGYCFMWVVASMVHVGIGMLNQWGYEVVYTINWVKVSKKGIYHASNGYYMQHDKETCLVGKKGRGCEYFKPEKMRDTIVTWRNVRQSHKPEELYEMIESAFPACFYLEIFARSHNLRDGWVSMGLEVP